MRPPLMFCFSPVAGIRGFASPPIDNATSGVWKSFSPVAGIRGFARSLASKKLG
jgi:hypothetical protein